MKLTHLSTIWTSLHRTLPITSNIKEAYHRPRESRKLILNSELFKFVYRSLGVTGPFLLCYGTTVLGEEMNAHTYPIALIVAVFSSLLTSFCVWELISSRSDTSGTISTCVYQLVGEFPAYCVAVLYFFISACYMAAMAKSLSATVDELGSGRLNETIYSIFGNLPLGKIPPDIFAFISTLVASSLLACGLQQSGFLRGAMNVISGFTLLVIFIVIGFLLQSESENLLKHHQSSRELDTSQVFMWSGVSCSFFFQFVEMAKQSKNNSKTQYSLPFAIVISTIIMFFICLSVGVNYSLLNYKNVNATSNTGTLMLKMLQTKKFNAAFLVQSSLQLIICGIGISEAGEIMGKSLISLASDGFIPTYISKESRKMLSHVRAQLFGGFFASFLALFMSHIYLLQFLGFNILLMNFILSITMLYRPYRCTYDTVVTVNVMPTPQIQEESKYSIPKLLLNDGTKKFYNPVFNWKFFKRHRKKYTEHQNENGEAAMVDEHITDEIPLLSALQQNKINEKIVIQPSQAKLPAENFDANVDLKFKDNVDDDFSLKSIRPQDLEMGSEDQKYNNFDNNNIAEVHFEIELKTIKRNCQSKNKDNYQLNFQSETPGSSKPHPEISKTSNEESNNYKIDEILEDEDIDRIVFEYKKEQKRKGNEISKIYSTKYTARKAFINTFAIAFLSSILSIQSISFSRLEDHGTVTAVKSTLIFLNSIAIIVCMLVLTHFPHARVHLKESLLAFPGSSWINFLAVFINAFLLPVVLSQTKWIVIITHFTAFIWYFTYSVKHSVVASTTITKQENPSPKFVRLDPMSLNTTQTSRPQASLDILDV